MSFLQNKIDKENKSMYLKGLTALPIPKRISRIEEYIYDNQNKNFPNNLY